MRSETQIVPASKTTPWAGRILTTIPVLFLLFDGLGKMTKVAPVMEACAQLEIPERVVPGLGVVLIVATLIYAFPQTSALGAIVLTGYLGGATWTHVRMGGPVFPIVFPSLVAAMIWGGLYMREPRLRALIPVRRQTSPAPGDLPTDFSAWPRDMHDFAGSTNTAGTPGLGTVGSGDVPAGAIGGLLAREIEPSASAVWGVHPHALAGEATSGDEGTTA